MTKVWILVFWFAGQPMASGPHKELEVCLEMAATQQEITGQRAHCYNIRTRERHYP